MLFNVLFGFLTLFSWSEYRVYELTITHATSKKSRVVYSTLDSFQYRTYHFLSRDETIVMTDHWMCWKRADFFKPLCKRPGLVEGPKTNTTTPEVL